jgi:enterochelin esterase family protein
VKQVFCIDLVDEAVKFRGKGGTMIATPSGRRPMLTFLAASFCALVPTAHAWAQDVRPAAAVVASPEVAPDRKVTLRLYAPRAEAVRLNASDIPGVPFRDGTAMTKTDAGVWEATLGPVPAGAYRYAFVVDGVETLDPRNPATSEASTRSWSLVYVPGSPVWDTRDVPHGSVAEVTYRSDSLGVFRRIHIYTPPGYETGNRRHPVLYLLHGAGDSDDSWTTAGRAGFILDNLIASKAAREMVIVMPAGHTPAPAAGASPVSAGANAAFAGDFLGSIVPHVETHYRVLTDRANTAIAGLSMGGGQTLDIATSHLEKFGYVGVFSSGLFGVFAAAGRGAAPTAAWSRGSSDWEKQHGAALSDAKARKGLRLFWFATGRDDFLLETTRATVKLFKAHGFTPVYEETDGGHTWINWRDYLVRFAPQLFRAS